MWFASNWDVDLHSKHLSSLFKVQQQTHGCIFKLQGNETSISGLKELAMGWALVEHYDEAKLLAQVRLSINL